MWEQNKNFANTELFEYESKLNKYNDISVRKCRKVCNRALNIKYTLAATETTIKSFIYYIGNQMLCVLLCKGFKELKLGLEIHNAICKCRSKEELNRVLSRYGISSGACKHL